MTHLEKLDTYALRVIFGFATISDHASFGSCLGLTYTPTTLDRLGAYLPGCEKRIRVFTTHRGIEAAVAYRVNMEVVCRYLPQSWDHNWGYWITNPTDRSRTEHLMQYASVPSLKRSLDDGDDDSRTRIAKGIKKYHTP